MQFGVTMFATDVSMPVPDLAVAAEERGFDSVWIPEHTHIPTSRRTPPPTGDAELPEEYKRSVDPLVALAAAAALTTTLRLGTGVMLPMQREPIVTAKAVATLQNLSGGRLDLGIGFGWNEDEMADHGVQYATRRDHTRDHVRAMQALWTDEVAAYDGEFVSFPPTWSWPSAGPGPTSSARPRRWCIFVPSTPPYGSAASRTSAIPSSWPEVASFSTPARCRRPEGGPRPGAASTR